MIARITELEHHCDELYNENEYLKKRPPQTEIVEKERIVEKIVEKPVTQIEYVEKIVEKPVTKIEYVEVDKPVKVIEYVEVEKPVPKIEYVDRPYPKIERVEVIPHDYEEL